MVTATALAGETMDALVWRALGNIPGAVEVAIELNPPFADVIILPEGAVIELPTITTTRTLETIQLWD